MKRNEIVESLIKEGFSEKTLVNFSDKQLATFASRILGEADIMISKKDPNAAQKIEDAKNKNQSIETYEEEMKEDNSSDEISKEKKDKVVKNTKKNKGFEIKDWVKQVTNENFHSFTSKNEIMEMIQFKLEEQEVGSNVKKGHNGIPEFMSYDVISGTETIDSNPTTKPAPVKPKTNPGIKPRTPYQPGPGKNPKPKALKETK
jgi:hypothetical protein